MRVAGMPALEATARMENLKQRITAISGLEVHVGAFTFVAMRFRVRTTDVTG
jgi:hypothetical protein